MPEWDPQIETGLSGDAYLSEQIEAFADGPFDAHEPGVYALKVSVPDRWAVVEERWDRRYDVDPPAWLSQAFEAEAAIYVGAAKDVYDRILEHLESENRTSALMAAFPVHSIWGVWWFDDPDRAFERESGIAIDVDNAYPNMYVHQR